MAIELISFADLKSFLGLEKSLIADYPALSVIRDSVTSAIETFISRELESKSRTEIIDVIETTFIGLKALPIASVTSVVNEDSEALEYNIKNFGIELDAIYSGRLTVVYTGGYATAPDAIKRAALYQTAYEWQAKDQVGATYVTTEGGQTTRPQLELLKEVKRTLMGFKHPLSWV